MKTTMRSRAVCMAFAVLFLMSTAVYAAPITVTEEPQGYYITEPYEYPVLPGTEEWEALPDNLAAKVNACAVPLDTLEHMTTGALLETVLTYPLLDNIFAFNTVEQGIESVSSYFHGINVLREREDAPQAVALMSQAHAYFTAAQNSEELSDEMLLRGLRLRTLSNMMTPAIEPMVCPGPGGMYAFETPAGVSIPVQAYATNVQYESFDVPESEDEMEALYTQYQNYYDIEPLRGISPKYNCHSYSFYCQETGNNVWLRDPSLYFDTGSSLLPPSYLTGYVQENSIVVYENTSYSEGTPGRYVHSARVESVPSGTNESVVVSKWGGNGLFMHEVTDCPYIGITVDEDGTVVFTGTATLVSVLNWNPANTGEPCPGANDF